MKLAGLNEIVAMLRASQSQHLPILYMVKDKNSRFQFITDLASQHTGSESSDELIGLTCRDLKCEAANFADDFLHYDNLCMQQRSEVLLLSLIHSAKGAVLSLISNKPIINAKNEIEGVETWVQILPSTAGLEKIIQGYQKISLDGAINNSSDPMLTLREQECVYYLTRGFTFVEIAEKLGISSRTVETHITNIKNKLNVKTRAELIVKICELGYLQITPASPKIQPGKLQLLDVMPCDSLGEILIA